MFRRKRLDEDGAQKAAQTDPGSENDDTYGEW